MTKGLKLKKAITRGDDAPDYCLKGLIKRIYSVTMRRAPIKRLA